MGCNIFCYLVMNTTIFYVFSEVYCFIIIYTFTTSYIIDNTKEMRLPITESFKIFVSTNCVIFLLDKISQSDFLVQTDKQTLAAGELLHCIQRKCGQDGVIQYWYILSSSLKLMQVLFVNVICIIPCPTHLLASTINLRGCVAARGRGGQPPPPRCQHHQLLGAVWGVHLRPA